MFRFILVLHILFMVTLPVEAFCGHDYFYHIKHHPFCFDYNTQRMIEMMFCRTVCRNSGYRRTTWYPFFSTSGPTFPSMSTNNEWFTTTPPYGTPVSNGPSTSIPPISKTTKSKITQPPSSASATPATSTVTIPSTINHQFWENAPPNNTVNSNMTESHMFPSTKLSMNASTTTGPQKSTTTPNNTLNANVTEKYMLLTTTIPINASSTTRPQKSTTSTPSRSEPATAVPSI